MAISNSTTQKTCRLCAVDQPLTEFYPRASSKDGHRADCKACSIARAAINQKSPARAAYRRHYYDAHKDSAKAVARAMYWANRETRRAQGRLWYRANCAEQRRQGTARARQWAIDHPDRARAKARKSMRQRRLLRPDAVKAAKAADYIKHKAKRLATVKAWRQRNPERVYAQAVEGKLRRRARLSHVVVEHVERRVVFERDGWICGICRRPVDKAAASIDHIVPIARGGAHTYENCQTAHLTCNISKGARIQETAV